MGKGKSDGDRIAVKVGQEIAGERSIKSLVGVLVRRANVSVVVRGVAFLKVLENGTRIQKFEPASATLDQLERS